MNKELKEAARLLGISEESLLDFSQETLNEMRVIMLIYDLTDEKMVMKAYDKLDKLWQKEVLQDAMKDVATVIGFDYDYETLCSLDEQTQSHLMYAYLNDKSDVPAMYEIARKGVIKMELVHVADLTDIPLEQLQSLPEQQQENIYGTYLFHYGTAKDEENLQKLIDNLRRMFLSYYDKEKSKNINGGKEMFFWKRKKKNLFIPNETAEQIPVTENKINSVSSKKEENVITSSITIPVMIPEEPKKESKVSTALNLQIETPTVLRAKYDFSSALKLSGLERYYGYYCKPNVASSELIKRVEQMKYKTERGLEGEKRTLQALKRTPLDMLVLKDLAFCYGEITTQIDFLVITSRCMIVMESKNWKSHLRIDSTGEFIDTEGHRWDNPIAQNAAHKEFICQLLPQFADRIVNLIVWVNEKAVLDRENASEEVIKQIVYVKNLSNTILSIHRSYADDIMNREEQKKVANAILSYCDEHTPTKHCPICGKKMVKKQGKESDFWGCSGYRDGCRYIESVN